MIIKYQVVDAIAYEEYFHVNVGDVRQIQLLSYHHSLRFN